jgi:hypothetical protein
MLRRVLLLMVLKRWNRIVCWSVRNRYRLLIWEIVVFDTINTGFGNCNIKIMDAVIMVES